MTTTEQNNNMSAGGTVPRAESNNVDQDGKGMPPHSWSTIDAEKFMVRQGPDYAIRKLKTHSVGPSFFDLIAVDWYKADRRLARAGGLTQLPKAEFSHPSVPSLVIVNVQLPLEVRFRWLL